MQPLPPAAKPMIVAVDCPWLPPISFGVKPYLRLCQSVDKALVELETRFPGHKRVLTLETRNKIMPKRRPK